MAAAPMEAQTAQPPSDPSSATYPRWVMFEQHLKIEAEGSSWSTSGDARKTLAAARTSTGLLIQVSLRLAEPPAVSCVCLQIPNGLNAKHSQVLAAHGDSVLIMVSFEEKHGYTTDYFVYNAGAASAEPPRLPSLSLLPTFRFRLGYHGTGLVRRSEDELVVAHLRMASAARSEPATPERMRMADLSLFRAGEWSVRRLQMRFRNASEVRKLPSFWDAVVTVGDGLLCWVDLRLLGVVLCDVFEETPRLQYVPLPRDNIWGEPSNRNLCATAVGGVLKFVNIFPRCCCGGAGTSCCQRSRHAYTIHTWTMRIGSDDDMGWVKDGMVDATELWALDSYKGLRSFPLDHPVVSMDDPDMICFWLHEPPVDGYWDYKDRSVDLHLLMVNMRSKTIHSVSRHEGGLLLRMRDDHLIPSSVSCFFNSYRSSGSDATLTRQRQNVQLIRTERRRASIPTLQPASITEPSVQASEIFEAFQEIPSYGLDHDEIIKAYSILSRDNCRRFRSFIRLPKNVRKDWLLMEIKANEESSLNTLFLSLSPKQCS